MTDKKTIKEKFKEELKRKKEALEEKLKDFSDEDLLAHLDKVTRVYLDSKIANKLGDFSFDTENVYHWHVYRDNNTTLLSQRLALGWGFATREDAIRAGLTDSCLADQTIDGETCVEMSHKSSRAVLLKIPKVLHDINRRAKERVKNNRPIVGADGNIVDVQATEGHDSVTRHHKEQLLTIK